MQFNVLLDLEFLTPYLPTLFKNKRQKHDTFAIIYNNKFFDTHTYTRTWQLYDQHGPEGRICKNRDIEYILGDPSLNIPAIPYHKGVYTPQT